MITGDRVTDHESDHVEVAVFNKPMSDIMKEGEE